MKIKLWLIFAVISIILVACSSKKEETNKYNVVSDIILTEQEIIVMTIDKASATGATILLKNNGEEVIGIGSRYGVEKKIDGKWYYCNMITMEEPNTIYNVWTDELYNLQPGEEKVLQLDWENLYGILEEGEYRITKTIGEDIVVGVEFAI